MPRIISGRFKGLRLASPPGRSTRPTADQVKEAVFSLLVSLPFDFEGARVLDFFAGSGALSLEALSRGAASAVLTDHDPAALTTIRRNLAAADSGLAATVLRLRWPGGFTRLPTAPPFNLFFLDPPYEDRDLPRRLLIETAARNLAAPGALAVWEQDADTLTAWTEADVRPWTLVKTRAWGRRAAAFLEFPEVPV